MISSWWKHLHGKSVTLWALQGLFNAAYGDDQDALAMGLTAFPTVLNLSLIHI